jgi:hypothetical protein
MGIVIVDSVVRRVIAGDVDGPVEVDIIAAERRRLDVFERSRPADMIRRCHRIPRPRRGCRESTLPTVKC